MHEFCANLCWKWVFPGRKCVFLYWRSFFFFFFKTLMSVFLYWSWSTTISFHHYSIVNFVHCRVCSASPSFIWEIVIHVISHKAGLNRRKISIYLTLFYYMLCINIEEEKGFFQAILYNYTILLYWAGNEQPKMISVRFIHHLCACASKYL